MGSASSIDVQHWNNEIPTSSIFKSETCYNRVNHYSKKSPYFDVLIHEMRFDSIWNTSVQQDVQESSSSSSEEDLGKELREVSREDLSKLDEEFKKHRYGQKVWDIIPKSVSFKLHLYEYLASYPCYESLQDRSKFLMKLLATFVSRRKSNASTTTTGNNKNYNHLEPVFTLLDLALLLHDYEQYSSMKNTVFNESKYCTMVLSLLTECKTGDYFTDESLRMDFELILEREYYKESFNDILDKWKEFEIDCQLFSRLVVILLRRSSNEQLQSQEQRHMSTTETSKRNDVVLDDNSGMNDGGRWLSMQPELMLPTPRQ